MLSDDRAMLQLESAARAGGTIRFFSELNSCGSPTRNSGGNESAGPLTRGEDETCNCRLSTLTCGTPTGPTCMRRARSVNEINHCRSAGSVSDRSAVGREMRRLRFHVRESTFITRRLLILRLGRVVENARIEFLKCV